MRGLPSRLSRRIHARWAGRGEEGFIIPIAMVLIMIGLIVGAAALTETLAARNHAGHDERSMRALQAADAGVETLLYRANQTNLKTLNLTSGLSLSTTISNLLTCPVPTINAGGQVTGLSFTSIASVGSACPPTSSSGVSGAPLSDKEAVGDHAYFEAQYIPGSSAIGDFVQFNPKIVASGVDDNGTNQIPRRVEAILAPFSPWRTLEALHNLTLTVPESTSVSGLGLLSIGAGSTTFNGTAAADNNLTITGQCTTCANTFTGGNISLSSGVENSALDSCNPPTETYVTVSLTAGSMSTPSSSSCSSTLVSRSAIQINSTKPDCVLAGGATESCSSDSGFGTYYVGGNQDEIYNTDPTKTISFQPGDYVFCSFQTNGPVSVNPSGTQAVRIFIDSPSSSRCKNFADHSSTGQPSGFVTKPGSFIATQGVGWNALSGTLSSTHPSQAQIYVAGDGTNGDTYATLTGGASVSGQSMFLYAPTSTVKVTAGTSCKTGLLSGLSQTVCVTTGSLAGAFIGWDVSASGTAISQDLGLLNYPLSTTLGPFYVKQYIECQPQYPLPSPDPTSGC